MYHIQVNDKAVRITSMLLKPLGITVAHHFACELNQHEESEKKDAHGARTNFTLVLRQIITE